MFKDELAEKIMSKFAVFRSKAYAYLIDGFNDDDYDKNNIVYKKTKGKKNE